MFGLDRHSQGAWLVSALALAMKLRTAVASSSTRRQSGVGRGSGTVVLVGPKGTISENWTYVVLQTTEQ